VADQGEDTFEGGGESNGVGGGGSNGAGGLDKLTAAFEQFQGTVASNFETLTQRLPEPEEEEQQFEFDPSALEPGDYELTETGGLAAMEQMVREAALEQVQGLQGVRDDTRRAQEADALEATYPRLADPQFQDEMISLAISEANRLGIPAAAREPRFLEQVYLASEARQRAASEVPAGQERGVTLERGSAASSASPGKEDDLGSRIVAADKQGKFRPFGGSE
jgi:hypothetical protein